MIPTKYQELKERIQELVPEIMELKFGCRINRFADEIPPYEEYIVSMTVYSLETVLQVCRIGNVTNRIFNLSFKTPEHCIDSFKRLGRPIRLADVLIAIGDQGLFSGSTMIGGDCSRVSFIYEPIGAMKHFVWRLTKDNLDDQSDEAKQFLYEILISKEKV